MLDKDSKLIFEQYVSAKNNILLEGDKWEDKSSAWAFLKILDPTGLSSWPDVANSAKSVRKNPESVVPWVGLILNMFLALPNFGILAFGVGGFAWFGLRTAAKTALKAGGKGGVGVANKVLKMASEQKFFRRALEKIAKKLKDMGIFTPREINVLLKSIKRGKLTGGPEGDLVGQTMRRSLQQSVTKGLAKTPAKTAQKYKYIGRAGKQGLNALNNLTKPEEEPKFKARGTKQDDNQQSGGSFFQW